MARSPRPSPSPLALEGDLDVFSVQRQVDRILAALDGDGDLGAIDLSAIRDLDLSGIQLICALGGHFKSRGKPLAVSGVREDWMPRLRLLGLADAFHGGAP